MLPWKIYIGIFFHEMDQNELPRTQQNIFLHFDGVKYRIKTSFLCFFEINWYLQHMRLADCSECYLADVFPSKIYIGTFATIWTKMAFQ